MTSTLASKDDNAALWLHNKLGSSTHLWSFSSTVASQYTVDKLQSIRDCFATLDSLVKFKFFLSLFHIPKRNFEEFKPIVQEIIENTIQTCLDQWVLSIAMFVQTYWMNQSLDTNIDYDLESFKEAIFDLKRILKECIETETGCERSRFLLPLEFDYLNKEARLSLLPNNTSFSNEFLYSLSAPQQDEQSLFKKHFNLFNASRTLAKLDDLKQKASHYSKSKTTKSLLNTGLMSTSSYSNDSSSYSSKIFTNTSNLSSFNSTKTSQNSSSSFFKRSVLSGASSTTTITGKSSAASKRIGGIKLLEVQEQPATPKEAKRKRKEQEKELLKKQKILDQQLGHAHHKPQTISQLIDQNNKDSEDDQLEDDVSKSENTNVSNTSIEIKNNSFSLNNNNNNNNNMNMNTSYDDMKTNIIKTNNDLLLSSTSSSATNTNPQLASITNQTNLINDTNPFQNKPTNLDQFNQMNNNNNNNSNNSNNYFSNATLASTTNNSSPLLLSQQFQQQQQVSQQQQQQQQMDLLYQPMNTNNHSPIQQQQQQQQQSPMLGQMTRLNSVLIQSDMNLIRSPQQQQQQQQSPQQTLQQAEFLQNFRTNTLNQNINNQNIMNNSNNNLANFNKSLLMSNNTNSSTPTKLEQFTISAMAPTTPTSPMIYPNFNANAPLNSFYTSPLASSNLQQAHQHQQQQPQQQQQLNQHPVQQIQQQPQQQNPPQHSLSLTREQMLQAQEMFSNSNKLSRPEKALILGFIAGSRENPRPEHGPLITIKLNESEEMLTSNGQQHRVLSELYFQMNYDTGEYKKIKKLKPIVLNT